jgi:hypothetical protein
MTLGRIGAGLLRPVNVNERPYPWVGSGTHAWVHYDPRSRSHLCQLKFKYSGTVTLDWGDGSQKVTLTNGNHTATTQTHTFADGDYRIDIAGDTPLHFGSYTYSNGTFTYTDNYGFGFLTNDLGFGTNYQNSVYAREALVQFETDSPMLVGVGNVGYCQVGSTANLKWVMLTEATAVANICFGNMLGTVGFFAPKCERAWQFVSDFAFPALKTLELPSLVSVFDDAGARQGKWIQEMPCLQSFSMADSVSSLPSNFLSYSYSLRSLRLSTGLSGVITSLCVGGCMSLERIEIPEGVTELAGESFRLASSADYVSFPSTFQSVSNAWAFYGMYCLRTLVCKATTPPTLVNNNILSGGQGNEGFAVWVPQGTISAYESATNWSKFDGKFHELDANGNIPQS